MTRKRKQCAKCPWKVSTDPRTIPRGYSEKKHRALTCTIAKPGEYDPTAPLRIQACHEHHQIACVGWLANQLGPGNNIMLRLAASDGKFGEFETVGKQHERFEDTLP